jgi:site-specific recombinase XerD
VTSEDDIQALLESWLLHLRAERKSKATVATYGDGVRTFLAWSRSTGVPPTLDRPTLDAFVADLLDAGRSAATARSRQLSVRRMSAWAADEGEIDTDRLVNLRPPKLDEKAVVPLTDAEIGLLLATCDQRSFCDRRDEAIIRILTETMERAEELLSMTVEGTNPRIGQAVIQRGKGGKGRVVPFSPFAARALDRYLRMRRTHRLAAEPTLWLGDRGHTFGKGGLRKMLRDRGVEAGITRRVHPHLFRHTGATRWLRAGGSQDGLMAVAGWSTPAMLHRYVKATQSERAAEEARRLNLGDL